LKNSYDSFGPHCAPSRPQLARSPPQHYAFLVLKGTVSLPPENFAPLDASVLPSWLLHTLRLQDLACHGRVPRVVRSRRWPFGSPPLVFSGWLPPRLSNRQSFVVYAIPRVIPRTRPGAQMLQLFHPPLTFDDLRALTSSRRPVSAFGGRHIMRFSAAIASLPLDRCSRIFFVADGGSGAAPILLFHHHTSLTAGPLSWEITARSGLFR